MADLYTSFTIIQMVCSKRNSFMKLSMTSKRPLNRLIWMDVIVSFNIGNAVHTFFLNFLCVLFQKKNIQNSEFQIKSLDLRPQTIDFISLCFFSHLFSFIFSFFYFFFSVFFFSLHIFTCQKVQCYAIRCAMHGRCCR